MSNTKKRWAIYIDIEGFGALCKIEGSEWQAFQALGALAEGILLIGQRCYPNTPDRLFAHQTGDGFIVVGEFGENDINLPVGIAISLQRHIAGSGLFSKASISHGAFADMRSCYPAAIQNAVDEHGLIAMGDGVMTIFPVMGTAMINAVEVAKRSPSGPLLSISSSEIEPLPEGVVTKVYSESEAMSPIVIIDWVHSHVALADEIALKAGLRNQSPRELENTLRLYCEMHNGLPTKWKNGIQDYLATNVGS